MSLDIARVDWFDPRAVALRSAMDAETGPMYAPLVEGLPDAAITAISDALAVHGDDFVATVVALDGDEPVGHAALRPFEDALEVKKVFVHKSHRGRGISKTLMLELEDLARSHGVSELILQTGTLQVEAIALYERLGYSRVPAYGGYTALPFAVCFRKRL